MTDTTLEEARRCPKCKVPGREVTSRRPREAPGVIIHIFQCENDRCEDEGDRWAVQTNPDGSIPQRGERGPKAFELPRESSTMMVAARQELKLIEFMTLHPELTEREARRILGD